MSPPLGFICLTVLALRTSSIIYLTSRIRCFCPLYAHRPPSAAVTDLPSHYAAGKPRAIMVRHAQSLSSGGLAPQRPAFQRRKPWERERSRLQAARPAVKPNQALSQARRQPANPLACSWGIRTPVRLRLDVFPVLDHPVAQLVHRPPWHAQAQLSASPTALVAIRCPCGWARPSSGSRCKEEGLQNTKDRGSFSFSYPLTISQYAGADTPIRLKSHSADCRPTRLSRCAPR